MGVLSELFLAYGQTGMSLKLSKASDIYSFPILAYELVHQQQTWRSTHGIDRKCKKWEMAYDFI